MNIKLALPLFLAGISGLVFAQNKTVYSIDFNAQKYEVQTLSLEGKDLKVRAFEKLVYVKNPVDTTYQILNVYVPEAYFQDGKINGYSSETAPIFFPNQVGGYMPATPASTKSRPFSGMPPMEGRPQEGDKKPGAMPGMPPGMDGGKRQSAVLVALSKGYVVASAGARGRTTKNGEGVYTGKAPAAIVDLKAAIRYLKFNDKKMPGDANKIISNGTSAGGAMSTLLGATGNSADYEPYLKALGAADGTDDIFAVSAYCPITNLDNADMAYEWQFNGINNYMKMNMAMVDNRMTRTENADSLSPYQILVSAQLKKLFPQYVNSLKLKDNSGTLLTLDDNGNGSFKELVKYYVMASAQKALDAKMDLLKLYWLKIENGKVTDLDFDEYVRYMQRQKTPPAFDGLDLGTPENQEFGTDKINKQHFTKFSVEHSSVGAKRADEHMVKMMNPMPYIGQPGTKVSQHWRIRHGSKDKDTGLAISVILGTYLQNKGIDVDLALPWDKPHSGDYDLDELFVWTDSLCK